MEEKVEYPVIFTETDDNILIEVPDLKIYTEANADGSPKGKMEDAMSMARDAIGLHCITLEDEQKELEEPSKASDIDVGSGAFAESGKSIISLVKVDLADYRRVVDNKSVRRDVTLPSWLNAKAKRAGVNVSKVLQDALKSELGIEK